MTGMDFIIETTKIRTGLSYIDAVLDFCEDKGLDFEDVMDDLHPSTLDKIKNEFIERNMVKGACKANSLESLFN